MDNNRLKSFLSTSIREVFEKMMALDISEESAASDIDWKDERHITACVSLAGKLHGNFYLQSSLHLANVLTGKLLMEPGAVFGEDEVSDAMGEIVNMIAGKFKALYSESFLGDINLIQMTVPTVVVGKQFELHMLGNIHVYKTTLDIEAERFTIVLELQVND